MFFNVVGNPDIDIRVKAENKKHSTCHWTFIKYVSSGNNLWSSARDYDECQARKDPDVSVFIAEPCYYINSSKNKLISLLEGIIFNVCI